MTHSISELEGSRPEYASKHTCVQAYTHPRLAIMLEVAEVQWMKACKHITAARLKWLRFV